jgi:hypothetical protein
MVVGPAPPVLSGEPLMRNVSKVLAENLKGGYRMEDLGIRRRIILKWSLQKSDVDWTHFAHDRGLWRFYKRDNKHLRYKKEQRRISLLRRYTGNTIFIFRCISSHVWESSSSSLASKKHIAKVD